MGAWEETKPAEIEARLVKANGQLQEIRGFLQYMKVPALIVDRTARTLWMNAAAESDLALKQRKQLGRPAHNVLGFIDGAAIEKFQRDNRTVLDTFSPRMFSHYLPRVRRGREVMELHCFWKIALRDSEGNSLLAILYLSRPEVP